MNKIYTLGIIVFPDKLKSILQTIEDSKDKNRVIIDVIEDKYKNDITNNLYGKLSIGSGDEVIK